MCEECIISKQDWNEQYGTIQCVDFLSNLD